MRAPIPLISTRPTNLLVKSLVKTENDAAANYVEFQKHFVKLNSYLKTNEDGIVTLQETIPGFFELNGGETAHFQFKNPMDVNPRGVIKF